MTIMIVVVVVVGRLRRYHLADGRVSVFGGISDRGRCDVVFLFSSSSR